MSEVKKMLKVRELKHKNKNFFKIFDRECRGDSIRCWEIGLSQDLVEMEVQRLKNDFRKLKIEKK